MHIQVKCGMYVLVSQLSTRKCIMLILLRSLVTMATVFFCLSTCVKILENHSIAWKNDVCVWKKVIKFRKLQQIYTSFGVIVLLGVYPIINITLHITQLVIWCPFPLKPHWMPYMQLLKLWLLLLTKWLTKIHYSIWPVSTCPFALC